MSQQKFTPYVHETLDEDKNVVRTVWKHYFVDTKSGVIYYEAKMGGRRFKFSTKHKAPNGLQAKRYANAEMSKRLGRRTQHVRTLIKEELALYKKLKESEGHEYDTMNNVYRAISEIEEFWGDMLPTEITPDNVTAWIGWWKENKKIQMENVVKYMRNFCKYLSRKVVGGYPVLPAIPVIADPDRKKNRAARKKRKENIFTQGDFKKIFDAASNIEERVICLLMYTMACRITETLEMSFGSEIYLDQDPAIYRWRDGQNKADLDGFHSLHPATLSFLRELKALRDEQGTKRLFPQQLNIHAALKSQQIDWKAWEKRAKIGWHWTSHTFKHTCLSNLFNDSKNPQLLICKLYRISAKEAEETYVKPTEEGRLLMSNSLRVDL